LSALSGTGNLIMLRGMDRKNPGANFQIMVGRKVSVVPRRDGDGAGSRRAARIPSSDGRTVRHLAGN
jgi:hypothetical protein